MLTRTNVVNIDLKVGTTYGAYFLSIESGRVTSNQKIDVNWLAEPSSPMEISLSQATMGLILSTATIVGLTSLALF